MNISKLNPPNRKHKIKLDALIIILAPYLGTKWSPFLLLFFLAACVSTKNFQSINEVEIYSSHQGELIHLTPKLLDELTRNPKAVSKPFVVEYYADWCITCKAIKPTMESFARKFKQKATLAVFDTTEFKGSKHSRGIPVFPKIVYFMPNRKPIVTFGGDTRLMYNILNDYPAIPAEFKMKQPDNQLKTTFLIGGATDITSFSNEVIRHREILKKLGTNPINIGCYFNEPDFDQVYLDPDDYKFVLSNAKDCYKADKKTIINDIKQAIASKSQHIYVYLTSHGAQPNESRTPCLALRRFRFILNKMPTCNNQDYLFQEDLVSLFKDKDPETKVTIVIQSCYAGGLVSKELLDVGNITIITSSQKDRSSFGCSSDEEFTYFGSAYLNVINSLNQNLENWDVQSIFQRVNQIVKDHEEKNNVSSHERSFPEIYTSKDIP